MLMLLLVLVLLHEQMSTLIVEEGVNPENIPEYKEWLRQLGFKNTTKTNATKTVPTTTVLTKRKTTPTVTSKTTTTTIHQKLLLQKVYQIRQSKFQP